MTDSNSPSQLTTCDLALQQQLTQATLLASVLQRIRSSLDLETILTTIVEEVREFLQTDRVVVFQVFTDGTSKATAESVGEPWRSIFEVVFPPEAFPQSCHDSYLSGRITRICNREQANIVDCMRGFMATFEVQAWLSIPIILGDRLWGLILAHQCSEPREWQDWEVSFMGQLARQLEIPLEQAELYQRLQIELEERKKAEAELRDLTERLERSNKELESFAYVSSHDLQEPLRKIQAFGDRLKSRAGDLLDEKSQDYLQRMLSAANRAQILIDNLLTFSRITTKIQPFTAVNLREVIDGVLSDLEIRIETVGGTVEVGELPVIEADAQQMRQLFQNLLGNALKFCREGVPPVVTITATVESNKVKIAVADNGIGFEEKYRDRIFEVFQRLHGRSEYEGTGIGLSICRKIVERHGGKIVPYSQPGAGATFVMTLPLQQSASM
ncbi:ATP-binding protein [Alkalinema sp. FACHB-956]|uniref:sensor histidine kinase n=1 Tax=Alkalinema sp. FACHB-956 TaxID=2692768 RepID=UPI001682C28B|nr:ATP-binding protein [Alkalinema sp. FACHB-956]MBD2328123.1 GAF domain-containing protein [Alkalinema sp. FACHB-956]